MGRILIHTIFWVEGLIFYIPVLCTYWRILPICYVNSPGTTKITESQSEWEAALLHKNPLNLCNFKEVCSILEIEDKNKTDGKFESTVFLWNSTSNNNCTQKFSDLNASFLEMIVMFGKCWLDRMGKTKELD